MDIRRYFTPIINKTPKYDVYGNDQTTTSSYTQSSIDSDSFEEIIRRDPTFSEKKAKAQMHSSSTSAASVDRQSAAMSSVMSAPWSSASSGASAGKQVYSRNLSSTLKKSAMNLPSEYPSFLSSIHNLSTITPKSTPSKARPPVRGSTFSKGSSSGKGRTPSSIRTPGSSRSLLDDLPPTAIVAMVEGRGQARREIGIASIDLSRPLLTILHFSDTHTYIRTISKLCVLNPLEIIFPNTAEEDRLLKVVRESFDSTSITTIHRKYFNERKGLVIIRHLAVPQCRHLERQISTKYYCLSAVAALFRYVEQIQHVTYSPHSLMVSVSSSEMVLTIDHYSCKKLELVRNLSKGWEYSLFGTIRYTSTSSGTRMLRASLLQPFSDRGIIETKLSALEYLTQNPELFDSLKAILGRFPDLDWILSMCVQKHKEDTEIQIEQRMNYVIGLKNTLELLSPLQMALETADNPFFVSVKESITCEGVENLMHILRQVLHEDTRLLKGSTAMKTQRCYAIKSDVDGLLDVARKIYSETVDDITVQVESLGVACGIPMRVGHNSSRGFHVIITLGKNAPKPDLPSCFTQVHYGRGCVTCTTEEIYQLDQRSKEIQSEILSLSNLIVLELISEIRSRVGILYGVAEAVAVLDMVVGLAHAASLGSWVRPEFSNCLTIHKGRHPILDLLNPTSIVPNDTMLNEELRVMIISGPNMSGKSTYLKQVALIQVLAQIGSFVPAESASIKMVDHLFTLLGCEDNPERNISTFQVQMNEVSVALQVSGNKSLIILDELGEGTNIEEGTSLGWAVVEGLLLSRSYVLFATHIFALTRLAELYPQVTNYYMESSLTDDKKLRLTHLLREGRNMAKNYGLALAASTFLPRSILERAQAVSDQIKESTEEPTPTETEPPPDDAIYVLAHRLLSLAATVPIKPVNTPVQNLIEGESAADANLSTEEEQNLKGILSEMLKDFVLQRKNIYSPNNEEN